MTSVLNTPLPGDLVIRPLMDETGLRRRIVFVLTVWPHMETMGGPYQSYGYARRQAAVAADKRQVQIWREYSINGERPQLENVTESDGV